MRRFFLAITGRSVPPRGSTPSTWWVIDTASQWRSPPIRLASQARERWLGVRAIGAGDGLVFRGSRATGLGLDAELDVVGIDRDGVVVGIRRLKPGSFVAIAAAHWLVELPGSGVPPPLGAQLCWRRQVV